MRLAARFRATRSLVGAFLLAQLLVVAPSHQAKASCDVLACGRLSADLITGGAAAAWQILKTPKCSKDLDDNIAVAAAILAIEELPNSPINNVNCKGSLQAIAGLVGQNAGNNPAIKAALSFLTDNSAAQDYLDCACPLAAVGAETINKIIADAGACSSFSPSDCIGSLYNVFDTPQLTTFTESCDFTVECGPGTFANCGTEHPYPPSCGNNVGKGYLCKPGLVVDGPPPAAIVCVSSGKTQTCTTPPSFQFCTCPVGQGWQGDHCGVCGPVTKTTNDSLSADGLTMTRTTCTVEKNPSADRLSCDGVPTQVCTGQQFKCPAGQKIASWGICAPVCNVGQVYDSNGQCNTCPANYKTVFDGPNTSKGACQECAANEMSSEGSYKCTELYCGAGGYKDPNKPHACILCPGNQIYSPRTRSGGKGPKAKQGGSCGCGESQVLKGDTCVCAKGANMHPGLTTVLSCSCPAGSKMNYKTGACVCGIGKHIETVGGTANSCVANGTIDKPLNPPVMPPKVKLPRKNCAALGPMFINNPNNPSACVRCGIGVNADRTACVRPDATGPVQRQNAPWALPGSPPGSGQGLRPIPGRVIVGPRR